MPKPNISTKALITLCIGSCFAVALAAYATAFKAIPEQQETETLKKLCTVQAAEINENSGIVLSQLNENTIWTHNDSGTKPIVYLISQSSGKTLATVSMTGAKNVDWEDIARFKNGDKSYIVIADVGDNLKRRETYQLLTFAEPQLDSPNHDEPTIKNFEIGSWKKINFKYADGAHNCEAVSIDFANRQVILLEKVYAEQPNVPGVYILDLPEKLGDEILTARRVAELPIKNITAIGLSSDANKIIARTYFESFLFTRNEGQTWADAFTNNKPKQVAIPLQRQGEGVCFSADDKAILCSSEFAKSPIWQVQLEEDE